MSTCGKPCEVYSRVVGYFRPLRNWNKGKKEEFNNREEFRESVATLKQQEKYDVVNP